MLLPSLVSIGLLLVVKADTWGHDSTQEASHNTPILERNRRLHRKESNWRPWPKAIMPYVIQEAAMPNKAEYERVIALYESKSCVRMPYWNQSTPQIYGLNHKSYMNLIKSSGCYSNSLGATNGPIGVSCCGGQTCVHEMGHTLGFSHEQGNPLRDGWVRANWNNVWPGDRSTYRKDTDTEWDRAQPHDITSVMHYAPWMHGVREGSVSVLFPELQLNWQFFYFYSEVAHIYQCDKFAPCQGKNLNCENDGYQTILEGKCACHCPTGLDPDNACKTPLKKVTTDSWPKGQYALPKPQTGCPNGGSFQDGKLTISGGVGNSKSNPNHLMGEVMGKQAELNFCTRTIADDVYDTEDAAKFNWPVGNFCIYLKGNKCPAGFSTHSIQYTVASGTTSGQVPDGNYGKTKVQMKLCCQYRGFADQPVSFPTDKPFALISLNSACQAVTGMHAQSESFTIASLESIKTEFTKWLRNGGRSLRVPICYYRATDMECGGSITLSKSNPEVTIEMNGKGRTDLECTWIIRGATNTSTLVFDFEDFNVKKNGKTCVEHLEVRHSRIGQIGLKYCGEKPNHSIRSITDKLLVRFFTKGNSDSSFKAKIKYTEFADMCYDLEDKRGVSYDGSVNYTRTFQPCLPWAEMSECYHHPYLEKDLFASLDGNACRNPDNSFRPWCYTDKKGCRRNYCDVCGIEVPHDRVDNCDKLKEKGFCTTDSSLAVQYCPKTCFDQLPSSSTPVTKYTDISCGQPTSPSDGDIVGDLKSRYDLGEIVQYKCKRGGSVVTSRCMTSGQWSQVGSACLECPIGFQLIDGVCYGVMQDGKKASLADAVAMCKKMSGTLAGPKNLKVATLIRNMAGTKTSWVGINDRNSEGTWEYEDGSKVTWTNWNKGEPNNAGNEDCAAMTPSTQWIDVPCSHSYSVACEVPKIELECVDVIGDKCGAILTDRPTLCDDKPEFARKFCHRTCGFCQNENKKCSVQNPNPNVLTKTTRQSISVGESVDYDCERFTYPTKGDKHQACLPSGVWTGEPLHCEGCPIGFKKVGNACHGLLEAKTLSFSDARKECQKMDGFVATPKNQAENDAISSLGLGQMLWLGVTDSKREGRFILDDGNDVEWTNWAAGEPKGSGESQDCTVMNENAMWVNVNCNAFKLTTVCTLPKSGDKVCYDRTDKGVTYNGKAHVTTKGKLCANWVDKGHCKPKGKPKGPFNRGMERYNLEANYCRNPGKNDRPWCYTDGCNWQYCDVCDRTGQPDYDVRDGGKAYRGTAHVTGNHVVCGNWVDKKDCNVNPFKSQYSGLNFEKNYCRNYDNSAGPWCYTKGCNWDLCDMNLANPLVSTNIVDIKCSPPPVPSDGEMVTVPRSSYKLGDEVTFKCNRNSFQVTTTCLTSGDWSPVGLACTECPVGYYLFNDTTCYGFINKMVDYDMAIKECSKTGGGLAQPKTIEENSFITSMSQGKYIWFDAQRYPDNNYKSFKWSDGTPVNWLKGEKGGLPCGFINPNGEWGSTACDFIQPGQMVICAVPKLEQKECRDFLKSQCTQLITDKPSMCQDHQEFAKKFCARTCGTCGNAAKCGVTPAGRMSTVNLKETIISAGEYIVYSCKAGFFLSSGDTKRACLPNGQLTGSLIKCQLCPVGYTEHNKFCYGFVDKTLSFSDAEKECKKINGYIASPKNEAENDLVFSLRNGNDIWIGASDTSMEGDFRWQDGTKLEWTNWNAGEPSNTGGYEDCVAILHNKKWNDQKCSKKTSTKLVCATPSLGDESCYRNEDKGATYGGRVSITDNSKPCIPWATATKCPHTPFTKGDEQKNLVENYCRNPDDSPGPWCYIDAETCDKKYCSVCDHEPSVDFTKVKCKAPTPPSDGVIQSESVKDEYNVGDVLNIVCNQKNYTIPITTTCLTTGQWSPVGLACTECPMGYHLFNGQCYGFANKQLTYLDARKHCHDVVGGFIASPKSSAENDFVHSLRQGKELWVGANDIKSEGNWVWEDGSAVTWNIWQAGEPNDWNGEDAAIMKGNKVWNDISDRAKNWFVCAVPKKDLKNLMCEDLLIGQCPLFLSKNPGMCYDHRSFATQFCAKTCGLCASELVECKVPSSSSLVKVDTEMSNIQLGDSVKVSCSNPSFYPHKGDQVRFCLNTGKLSGSPLECREVLKAPTVTIGAAELKVRNKATPPRNAFFGEGKQYHIENKGQIVAWEFYSVSPIETAFQVWRKTQNTDDFTLIGQNVIMTGDKEGKQRYDVPAGERINVEPGDYIGIANGGNGGVRFDSCDGKANLELLANFRWSKKLSSVKAFAVGTDYRFSSGVSCVLFSMRAIVAVFDQRD